jgi:hypothetical protein
MRWYIFFIISSSTVFILRSLNFFNLFVLPPNDIFNIHISVLFQKTMYGANVIIFEGILAFYYAEILKVSFSLF